MHTTNRSLEGLRGVAALIVLLFHLQLLSPYAGIVRNGYLAVDFFFVLSGFVIHSAYGNRLAAGSDVWRFVIRRFGRLWPIYMAAAFLFLVVFDLGVASAHLRNMQGVLPHFIVYRPMEILEIASMTQGFDPSGDVLGVGVSWSVSDEFYVCLIFAAVCYLTLPKWRQSVFVTLALIGYVIAAWVSIVHNNCMREVPCLSLTYSFGWARCLAGFFVGVLIAANNGRFPRILKSGAAQVVIACIAIIFMWFADRPHLIALFAPLTFAMVIITLSTDTGPVASFLHCRPIAILGKISYPLYLSHVLFWPQFISLVIQHPEPYWRALAAAVFFLEAFVTAHFLHKYIEIPFRERIYAWAESRIDHDIPHLCGTAPKSAIRTLANDSAPAPSKISTADAEFFRKA